MLLYEFVVRVIYYNVGVILLRWEKGGISLVGLSGEDVVIMCGGLVIFFGCLLM